MNEPHSIEYDRRSFLRVGVAHAGASLLFGWSLAGGRASGDDGTGRTIVESANAPWQNGRAKACVLVWLGGGPSQLETWDPKPGHANGGPTKAIRTSGDFEIAEHFPEIAKEAKDACLVRSLTSPEGDHGRAAYLLHTGYRQTGALTHPSLGAIVSHELGRDSSELPHFVSIGGNSYGPGYLGVRHGAFNVENPARPVPHLELPEGVDGGRFRDRLGLLSVVDRTFLADKPGEFLSGHRTVRHKAIALLDSPRARVFDVRNEPEDVREAFGSSGGGFALQALMAARLVEEGVPFVELHHNGWDTHTNNFAAVAGLGASLDPGVAGLVRELRRKSLLDTTLVVVMGEFGRTPRINRNVGRDHFPRCFSVLLAGGGVRGGTVVGRSTDDGMEVDDRAATVADLYATVLSALRIDPVREIRTAIGRSIKLADGGEPITEALS